MKGSPSATKTNQGNEGSKQKMGLNNNNEENNDESVEVDTFEQFSPLTDEFLE